MMCTEINIGIWGRLKIKYSDTPPWVSAVNLDRVYQSQLKVEMNL